MSEQQASYRQIFKATSIFGGVQVFSIFISLIRSKFIAVILGPAGMGISGLLTSTTGFITALTNFGLGTSAVKSVVAASTTGDETKVSKVVTVLRRLVWITGMLGTILTAVLSSWLSQLTFGNRDYTFAFIWISITLLFMQLSSGQMVVLQGLRRLNHLAKANVIGLAIGLIISIPIYYIWRLEGIVPVLIICAFINLLVSWYFAYKTGIKSVKISSEKFFLEGKEMLTMGFMLSLSGIISYGASYVVRIYVSNMDGIEQVGLYNAGFAIINTYVGMVFSAMGTDYYPRLSAIAQDNINSRQLINQQAEVAILILAPILIVFMTFINWIVIIIYSQKFTAVNPMIQWAALGMYFKAASWSIGFILLAKGATKTYFWNEMLANFYILGFNIVGYWLAGLEGLGISFLLSYFIYLLQIFLVAKFKYDFTFNKCFYKVFGLQVFFGFLCFTILKTYKTPMTYFFCTPIILTSALFSYRELNRRIDLEALFRRQLNKHKR